MQTEAVYQVAPRYTPGSPAQTNLKTAERVAREEAAAYRELKDQQELQGDQDKGLDGIVECLMETRDGWHVFDLITGKRFTRPFEGAKSRDGFPDLAAQPTRKLGRLRQLQLPGVKRMKKAQGALLLKMSQELAAYHADLTSSQDGMPEDPGLVYVLADLRAMIDRLAYLGGKRRDGTD